MLALSIDDYKMWAEPITRGFERASRFLYSLRFFAARDLPYGSQLVPLRGGSSHMLGDDADNDGVKSKVARWFWCGVFGELYGGAIESRFAKDVAEVIGWARKNGAEPSTIADATFVSSRLFTLRTKEQRCLQVASTHCSCSTVASISAPADSVNVQTYFDEKIDIHHIFPKKWCATKGIDRRRYDSIINKTAISAKTNRMIGGNAPSTYLGKLEKSAGISVVRMDDILKSHVIDPALIRPDIFDAFFAAREKALLQHIEKAMGKPSRMEVQPVAEAQHLVDGPLDDEDVDDEASLDAGVEA